MRTGAHARAVTFVAPRRIAIEPVRLPDPGPGNVLVRVLCSGISAGTEMLAYRGELEPGLALDETLEALAGTFDYPFRYGYSCVGRVEESDGGPAPGTLVFAYHAHQDRIVVAADDLVVLGEIDPRSATLLPLVETALQVSLDAGPVAHLPVVVLGLGSVGTLTAALLARAGAVVAGVDPRDWRRKAADAFGVTVLDPDEVGDWVAGRTDGRGVPLVVEASGNPGALAGALGLLAHEGVALVASWYGDRDVPLPLGSAFHRRRLTIRSTQVSTIPAALQDRWGTTRRRAVAARLLSELP
ncbi:MAG TPA: zinc-binding dehydrogenase, partial [Euzebyales bacterium]|nr:zinc-binding dehydrogenase [Euzebyales bacterium]